MRLSGGTVLAVGLSFSDSVIFRWRVLLDSLLLRFGDRTGSGSGSS